MRLGTVIFNLLFKFLFCGVLLWLTACEPGETKKQVSQVSINQQSEVATSEQVTPEVTEQQEEILLSRRAKIETAPGNIVVMALSAFDSRAVVKSAQGKLQMMKPGDVVQGTAATLLEVLDDRLVFEEIIMKPSGLKVKKTTWVYKAMNGTSQVKVLKGQAPKGREITVKKTIVVSG